MTGRFARLAGLVLAFGLAAGSAALALEPASVERGEAGKVTVRWTGADPVDVYVSARPDAAPTQAHRLAKGDHDGAFVAKWAGPRRPYFLLRDEADGRLVRVAERVLSLDRGSNVRDVGGYPAADGRHVRWGLIYRTAAMPMLTDADYEALKTLNLRADIDLRSSEERVVAPDGVPAHTGAVYLAHDYPADDIFGKMLAKGPPSAALDNILGLYREWPVSLAPQYRDLFDQLLAGKGAVTYHCSAGQDRTGVATALVLSALGVPREVILADYHLSTAARRPANEMPPLPPGAYPGNIVADFYRRAQASGAPMTARPLKTPTGEAFMEETFKAIDARWGSVDAYLDQELGVDAAKIARLRALYLE